MIPPMHSVKKTLTGFSTAHRMWRADSHCRFVHGYDRRFILEIAAEELDDKGWVFDFGGFKEIRKEMENQFDHTLCLSIDDPLLPIFGSLQEEGGADIRLMANPGMEGAAEWVMVNIGSMIFDMTDGRCSLISVEAHENDKNCVRLG